jgi:hypothetical protein
MNFDFSDEQKALKSEARRFLADVAPLGAARAVLDAPGASRAGAAPRFRRRTVASISVISNYARLRRNWAVRSRPCPSLPASISLPKR